jgi:phage-related protein
MHRKQQGEHLCDAETGEGIVRIPASPRAAGSAHSNTKALPQFGPGVYELREAFDTNAYRLMYVVRLKHAVYVLHAFMKKSKSGIALPKADKRLIEARLKRAIEIDRKVDNEKN